MKERIIRNEERLNSVLLCIKKMEEALNEFNDNEHNINLLNKYYGSKNWFIDKEEDENNKLSNIRAGVLSEDAVWNMNEDIKELIFEMKKIIERF